MFIIYVCIKILSWGKCGYIFIYKGVFFKVLLYYVFYFKGIVVYNCEIE